MPNVQPNYSQHQPRAQLGMIATTMYKDVVSKTNIAATAIPFGRACTLSGEDGCQMGAAGTFAGVSVAQAVLDQVGILTGGANAEEFEQNESVGLIRNGTIWVLAGDAISAGDVAKWNDNGTIGQGAGFPNAFPGNAYFETDAAIGELVRLRIEA